MDYEKFIHVIQRHAPEAVDECLGIPDNVVALIAEAVAAISLEVETRWGLSPAITSDRYMVQGSVPCPEQSKPSQAPVLGIHETSPACYVTSSGRKVYNAGHADDTEHYGSGAKDLTIITDELSSCSNGTGMFSTGQSLPRLPSTGILHRVVMTPH